MFSVKWYEPLNTTQQEKLGLGDLLLPTGRGYHEQTVTSRDKAENLVNALRRKGFAVVSYRKT